MVTVFLLYDALNAELLFGNVGIQCYSIDLVSLLANKPCLQAISLLSSR